ncbi:YlbF family regulator [Fodinisporobacter ferrooxydans]|uniref:YlbF family regulator n=1 Tax=Fodinisporobacter ferrooxydans TaxID=2901836 RepID=A0ABY4CI51_9BACL|nr:YlbF family regulator [Alicyclobacillaceae bacterium MYW30-H2]
MADRNKIWEYANELGVLLSQSPEVAIYKQAEQVLNENMQAQSLIRQFRELQEQLAQLEERGAERKYTKPLRDQTMKILKEIDSIPEVRAFKEAQEQVNELLSSVSNLLASVITQKVEDLQNSCES